MPWINVDGWDVLKQSHEQSCGYCCIGMVVNLIEGGRKDREESIVAAGRSVGGVGAYDRHAKDRVGAVQTPLVQAAYEEFGALPHWGSGTYGNHLAQVLRRHYRMDATYYKDQGTSAIKSAMRGVSAKQYMIALVQWDGGGGHWVLVVERHKRGWGYSSDYAVLDPGGYVTINRGSSIYNTVSGARGKFGGYFVLVSGYGQLESKSTGVKVM
jgi:hypothetical protein